MKIIQTNLSLKFTGEIADHQSLMYEVDMDWETFVESIKSGEIIKTKNSTMPGAIGGKFEIIEMDYDKFHMSVTYANQIMSLFYMVDGYSR